MRLKASVFTRRRRSAGLASVEAILVLPFLLLIVLLLFHGTRLSLLKQRLDVAVRSAAWQQVMAGACNDLPHAYQGGQVHLIECPTDDERAQAFLGDMERAGGSDARDLTSDVRSESQTAAVEARGSAHYSLLEVGLGLLTLRSRYQVDAAGFFEREDHPLGYDRELVNRLDSDHLFDDSFPKVD